MRDSELGSLKHRSRTEKHKSNNGLVIREVPIQRMNREAHSASEFGGGSKGKRFWDAEKVMRDDYDTPEMVVFLQEDTQVPSKLRKESESECCEGTKDTVASASNESIISDMCGFRNLVMMVVEGDHLPPTRNTTSDFHEEEMDEEQHIPRSFNNWHNIQPFVNTISSRSRSRSRMEFPHGVSTLSTHETGNSQSLDGHRSEGQPSSCAVPATPPPKSATISHQSGDSISSAHSFTFPILPIEWSGSPVRMAEADRSSQSRRHRWRKICCPCCNF